MCHHRSVRLTLLLLLPTALPGCVAAFERSDAPAPEPAAAAARPAPLEPAPVVRRAPQAALVPDGAVAEPVTRDPLAPFARSVGRRGEETLLHVTPRESRGAILVADGRGRVFGRHPLTPTPWAAHRDLELLVVPAPGETSVRIAHELPDGRRSAWRPAATPGGAP